MIYLYFFFYKKSGLTMAGSAGTVATPLPTTWGVLKVVPNSEAGIVQSLYGSIRSLRVYVYFICIYNEIVS